MRLNGASYAEIAAAGGGIISTVNATRSADQQQLLDSARKRIDALRKDGVTALEIKSGYGLSFADERKMLQVIRMLADEMPLTLFSTCLAAHALPAEYTHRADEYIDDICQRWLPDLHTGGLVDAVDAFCEHLAFSPRTGGARVPQGATVGLTGETACGATFVAAWRRAGGPL